jgi:hypothetical protein
LFTIGRYRFIISLAVNPELEWQRLFHVKHFERLSGVKKCLIVGASPCFPGFK